MRGIYKGENFRAIKAGRNTIHVHVPRTPKPAKLPGVYKGRPENQRNPHAININKIIKSED